MTIIPFSEVAAEYRSPFNCKYSNYKVPKTVDLPEGFELAFVGSNKRIPVFVYPYPVSLLYSPLLRNDAIECVTQVQPNGKTIVAFNKY